MRKWFLVILAILSILYGLFVFRGKSGSWFWIVWECLGTGFLVWAWLLHKDFFATHPICKAAFCGVIILGILLLGICSWKIFSRFSEKGNPQLDYIIVLGAQVWEDGPSAVLKYRLDAAITYLEENPDTKCVVSGGQGYNEPFTEAEGMAKYLIEQGISKERILLEELSTNTVENIRYSQKLLDSTYESVGIVTNHFHLYRAVGIAKKQGLRGACGIAAKSTPLYLPNNLLRECIGLMKDWLMGHL